MNPGSPSVKQFQSLSGDEFGTRGAAAKVLAVLEAFLPFGGTVGVVELARRAELPKSTTHRMLQVLREAGFVGTHNGGYHLGERVRDIADVLPQRLDPAVRAQIMPYLTDLHDLVREPVHLSVWHDDTARAVDRVFGRRNAEFAVGLGTRFSLTRTTIGKVLLAGGQRSAQAATWLSQELDAVRRLGVACDRDSWRPGVSSIAAPVWAPGRRLVAAISVTGPSSRFDPSSVAPLVRRVAHSASREIQCVDTNAFVAI